MILSADFFERLVTIHPFIDLNGRTSRLMMNLISPINCYPITTLENDYINKLIYYESQ
jgi:Fic family protein